MSLEIKCMTSNIAGIAVFVVAVSLDAGKIRFCGVLGAEEF